MFRGDTISQHRSSKEVTASKVMLSYLCKVNSIPRGLICPQKGILLLLPVGDYCWLKMKCSRTTENEVFISAFQPSTTTNQSCCSRQNVTNFTSWPPRFCSLCPPSIFWQSECSLNEVMMGDGGSRERAGKCGKIGFCQIILKSGAFN